MKPNPRLETLAGIFLLAGLGIIGTLIIGLRARTDLFKPTYNLSVLFPDASGLLRGSDVYLCGAQIGKETTNPQVLPDTGHVEVRLKIDRNVKLRRNAIFSVGGSGFASEKFVEVRPQEQVPQEASAPFIANGDVITGVSTPNLQSLERSAQPLILRSRHIAAQVDSVVTKLNKQVLTEDTVENLKATVAGFRTLAINNGQMVANAEDMIAHVRSGHGALGRLLYDKAVCDNLAAFMTNLRAYGPIFYRDAAPEDASSGKMETETLRERYEGN